MISMDKIGRNNTHKDPEVAEVTVHNVNKMDDEKSEIQASSQTGQDMQPSVIEVTTHGDLSLLKALVDSGESINEQDSEGRTPLAIACYQGWYEGTVFLLAHGAEQTIADNNNRLPLHAATYDQKIRCLALLLQHIQPQEINLTDCESMTALHWAAYHGRPDHLQLLISKNCKMAATDCDGKTPLHWACQRGNTKCVEILVRESRGTNLVNMRDNSGKGAIHYCAAAGHYMCLEQLGKLKSCILELPDVDDRYPLHWAAAMGRTNCVQLLLKLGAEPDLVDINGRNALHYAKKASHTECSGALISRMKQLNMAKKGQSRAVSVTSGNEEVTDGNKEKCNSSQISTTDVSDTPTSANKLPPIRGLASVVNNVQGRQMNSDQDKKTPTPDNQQQNETLNTAMAFVPTRRLYVHSSDDGDV